MRISEEKAVSLYKEGLTIKEISERAKCRQKIISDTLKKHELHVASKNQYRLGYKLNHSYFSKIDSRNKAYLLGLLYADGSVSSTTNQISFVSNDTELLSFLKKEIQLSKSLYKNPKHEKAKTIWFSSAEMKQDLIKLGCCPKKSLILRFPSYEQVPQKFLWDFLRGYFDGDGSIYTTNNQKQAYFLGTYDFLTEVQKSLNQEEIETNKIKSEQNIWRLVITGKNNLAKLNEKLYQEAEMFLTRKKERFSSCL